MAEVGGMLAGGVLKLVAGKVAEATGDRLMLQWRFGEDLEGMKVTAESIQAVLEDAERKSLAETSFKVLNPCLTLPSEVRMAAKMKVVREKLDIISKERDKYSLATSNSNNVQQVINDRATSPETYRKYVTFGEEKGRKDITFFTMHDLVYDLVRSVMGDELLDASEEFSKRGGSSFRYAFLADCSKPLNSYVPQSLGFRSKFLKEVAIFYWSTETVEVSQCSRYRRSSDP
nr:unnamed protein product [Digitaria exilis]